MRELLDLLAATGNVLDEMLAAEDEKIEAIAANDIPRLDDCIKKEEALSLKLRGLDKKRDAAQAALGFGGLTLRQIADTLPPPEQAMLLETHEVLGGKVQALQLALEAAKKLVDLNQQDIDAVLADRAAGVGYEKNGEKAEMPKQPPRLTVDKA